MFRNETVSIPAGVVGDPTTLLYEYQTGDLEVWIEASGTTGFVVTGDTLYSSGVPVNTTKGFRSEVGPGDKIYGFQGAATSARVMVRAETA